MWKILWLIAFRQVKFHHREFIYLTFRGDKDKQTANAKQTCTLINGEEILWILHTEKKETSTHKLCFFPEGKVEFHIQICFPVVSHL